MTKVSMPSAFELHIACIVKYHKLGYTAMLTAMLVSLMHNSSRLIFIN